MAAWANFLGAEPRQPGKPVTALVRQQSRGKFALRDLPNEDIALWVKEIDNSRVEGQRDPGMNWALLRYVGGAVAAAGLVVGLLLPGAYSWLAGYQMSQLEQQKKQLLDQRDLLRLEQTRVESPKQMEAWASEHGMTAPDAKRLVYLQPSGDKKAVAQLTGPKRDGAASR